MTSMPELLRTKDETPTTGVRTPPFVRRRLLAHLRRRLHEGQDISLVGVSNMGKSELLRRLGGATDGETPPPADMRCFYIDCNRLLEWSEQAFYELILRTLLAAGADRGEAVFGRLREAYDALLTPASRFHVPLQFNEALTAWLEAVPGRTAFIFDEFDAPFTHLEPRVFLNLRGWKDRYPTRLHYVVATDQTLARLRQGEQVDEFIELFRLGVHYLPPWEPEETRAFIAARLPELHATFDEHDIAFVLEQAGGHPVLTDIVCRHLAAMTGEAHRDGAGDLVIHRQVRDLLRHDAAVQDECTKIWRDLDPNEQKTLLALFDPTQPFDALALAELERKGLVRGTRLEPHFFADLFRHFVRQMAALTDPDRPPRTRGVWVDVEAGEVWVDGRQVEPLTNLEYRLLLLLYGHLNKICDKYQIVEAVWGEAYIDQVYDASIEKLVSRLRHKIEPDPANPRYLLTVRGRGYKLVG
jgi:hypothetical protein